jgi:hypothetical protein
MVVKGLYAYGDHVARALAAGAPVVASKRLS